MTIFYVTDDNMVLEHILQAILDDIVVSDTSNRVTNGVCIHIVVPHAGPDIFPEVLAVALLIMET
jgi:hypothetical protein